MKILHIVPYFDWSYGGTVASVYGLVNALNKSGHEMTVYTTNISRSNPKNLVNFLDRRIKLYYFKCINNFIANKFHINISKELRINIKNNIREYDVVHLHEFRGLTSIYVWYYASKYKIPYIIQAHGAVPIKIYNDNMVKVLTKIFFDKIIGKLILNSANKIIALTDSEKKEYIKLGISENKIEVIPNGINFSEYEVLPEKGLFKNKFSLNDDDRLILYLGRIQDIKGIDILLLAFAKIKDQLKGFKLVIVGPDEGFLSYLQDLAKNLEIEDRLLFTGAIYGKEKIQAYRDSEIYVLPSIYETFPNTVLEASACGIPIIITKNCGISEIVHNKFGFAVPTEPEKMSKYLIKLISDDNKRNNLGIEGRKIMKNYFSWIIVCKKFEKIYESVSKENIN